MQKLKNFFTNALILVVGLWLAVTMSIIYRFGDPE